MVARFFDAPDSYSINYYCSVEETSPVYSDVIEFDKRVAPQSLLCLTAKPYYTQIGWFTPFTSEEITHYQALCRAEGNTDCDIVIEDFLLEDSDLSLLFLVLMIVQGGQQNDSSSASDYLTKLMYEHVYISGDVAGEPIGKQVLDAGSDLNLYGVYARNGYQTIDDCGAIAMPYYYLFESNVGHYNEEFEVQGMCSFFYDWYINNQTDGGFGYAVGGVARFVGWDIDGKIYAHGDKFVWDTQSDKPAIGIYDFKLHATFDCGADGVLASGGADVKYSGRGNGNDMIPLNINAVCAPNEGKRFVGWKLPYHDVTNPKGKDLYFEDVVFEVGDTLDWLDVIYAHDQTIITKEDGSRHQINKATDDFIAVYEDVE